MKVKPSRRDPGSVMVELGPNERAILGVTAEHTPTPLTAFKLKRILVPGDFSDCSEKALQYAVPLARQFDAKLSLLHVVEPYRAFCPEIPLCEMPTAEEVVRDAGCPVLIVREREHEFIEHVT